MGASPALVKLKKMRIFALDVGGGCKVIAKSAVSISINNQSSQ